MQCNNATKRENVCSAVASEGAPSCSQFFIFKSIIVVLGHRKITPYKPINQLTKTFDLYHKINLCLTVSFFFKTDEAISSVAVVFQYLPFCQFQAESIHTNMSIRSCSCSFWWERMSHMIVNRDRERECSHKKEMQYWLTTYYTVVYTAYYILTFLQSDQKSKKMFKLVAVYTFDSFVTLEMKDQVKHIVLWDTSDFIIWIFYAYWNLDICSISVQFWTLPHFIYFFVNYTHC